MIEHLGIEFKKGQSSKIDFLNIMVDRINQLITIVNQLIKDRVNINIEILGTTDPITFGQALESVPEDRRVLGITIKYNDIESGWSTYIWTGRTWESKDSWTKISDADIIDGGEI